MRHADWPVIGAVLTGTVAAMLAAYALTRALGG